jgi:hypothetical protein
LLAGMADLVVKSMDGERPRAAQEAIGRIQPQARNHMLLVLAVALALALLPLFVTTTLPLVDYYNHLARMHILAADGGSAALNRYYAIHWRPVPNLAMDLVVPALAHLMPLELAGKVFIAAIFLLMSIGTVALHRALFRRWSAWPCLAVLFLYSRVLVWGFLNVLFGVGLCMLGFALWVGGRERWPRLTLVVAPALSLAIYVSHLLAFGAYGLLVVTYEIGQLRAERRMLSRAAIARLAIAGIQFVVPVALFLLSGDTSKGRISFGNPLRKFDLFFTVFNDYNLAFDGAGFALIVLFLLLALRRGWLILSPRMTLPLLALLLVHFALPNAFLTASGVDHRLPVLIALIVVASTDPRFPSVAFARRVGVAAAALFVLRMAVIVIAWQRSEPAYAEYRRALDLLPVGARVAVAHPDAMINVFRDSPPLAHFATMAVIRRDAFVPTLFAQPTQQPVLLVSKYRELADRAAAPQFWAALVETGSAHRDAVDAALCGYNFIVFVDRRPFHVGTAPALRPVAIYPTFQLYEVRPCAPPQADPARPDR